MAAYVCVHAWCSQFSCFRRTFSTGMENKKKC